MKSTLHHCCALLAGGILILAGCSSTPSKVDHGPIHARTFNFVPRSTAAPSAADARESLHRAIQGAIIGNLASRGVSMASATGDVTVRYLVIIGNNASTERIADYFGISDDAEALHEKAQNAYTESGNPGHFQAGTLIIDILDSKSFEMLNRGYVTRPALRELSEADRAARIQEAVDSILSDVKIAP
ncbi:MAG TPA: DUF4136 domain-containing protein [Candidatus Dormibacteraeota bacterium]|nr:DUF4136 domain-containing protein [Candidatus Dormibacteraeota bacterium]